VSALAFPAATPAPVPFADLAVPVEIVGSVVSVLAGKTELVVTVPAVQPAGLVATIEPVAPAVSALAGQVEPAVLVVPEELV